MFKFVSSIGNWFINNLFYILSVLKWVSTVVFIITCFTMIILVLLQRGEEGVFSKSRSNKISTDNNTLINTTIICAIILFGTAILLNGLVYYLKHNQN